MKIEWASDVSSTPFHNNPDMTDNGSYPSSFGLTDLDIPDVRRLRCMVGWPRCEELFSEMKICEAEYGLNVLIHLSTSSLIVECIDRA
jgi:hypothetical protein